jgi:hypothetical protein
MIYVINPQPLLTIQKGRDKINRPSIAASSGGLSSFITVHLYDNPALHQVIYCFFYSRFSLMIGFTFNTLTGVFKRKLGKAYQLHSLQTCLLKLQSR